MRSRIRSRSQAAQPRTKAELRRVLGRRSQRQEPCLRPGSVRHRRRQTRCIAADPYGRPHRGPAARGHGRSTPSLSHAWAVTVTGAPKLWASGSSEPREPRAWYGGAIEVHFNGDMNTGLTLRTIRIKDGIAEVRAGATLLFDSDPEEEEAETELKASAMLSAIRQASAGNTGDAARQAARVGEGLSILLVDHEDSFVHTLANYFRQTGASVTTVRSPVAEETFDSLAPTWSSFRRGRAVRRTSIARRRSTRRASAVCRYSGSAWVCRRSPKPMAVHFANSMCRCTESRRGSGSTETGWSSPGCRRK